MLYFAYGSNLHEPQMRWRCPSAVRVGAGRLVGFRPAFTRYSTRRRCGVLDVVAAAEATVWGGLWELDEDQLPALDRAEFCHRGGYRRIEVAIEPVHCDGAPIGAVSYEVVDKHSRPILPSATYLALVLAGARQFSLPANYVRELAQLASMGFQTDEEYAEGRTISAERHG